jgi:uncharacterized protein
MRFIKILFVAGLLGSAAVQAASFDCNKARSRVEKLICSQPQLGELDERLSAAFRDAKDGLERAEAQRVTETQIRWLRRVRDRCVDAICLENAYVDRLNQLYPAASEDLTPAANENLTCESLRMMSKDWPLSAIDTGGGGLATISVDYECPDSLGQLPFMQRLLELAEKIRSEDSSLPCGGTLFHPIWRSYQLDLTQLGMNPRAHPQWSSYKGPANWKNFVDQGVTGAVTYFRQWAEQSPSNQAVYAAFSREFDQAASQLVSRYRSQLSMSTDEAQSATLVALARVVKRAAGSAPKSAEHAEFELLAQLRAAPLDGTQVKPALAGLTSDQALRALKVALIHKQPTEVVALLADAVDPAVLLDADGPKTGGSTFDPEGLMDKPEPLLSLALGSLANLEYLVRKQVPVNAINGFGKSTLFYAIGTGNHDAVNLLLQHKANVRQTYKSAEELRPPRSMCVFINLEHTRRTTLMHAAQNSDVRMIKILLESGASLQAQDDLGFNAHDYALMGKNRDNALYLGSLGLEPAAPR